MRRAELLATVAAAAFLACAPAPSTPPPVIGMTTSPPPVAREGMSVSAGSPGAPAPSMAPLPPIPSASEPPRPADTAPSAPAKPPPSATPPPATSPPPAAAPATMALSKDPLAERLLSGGGAVLKSVLANPEKYRFQVLYGVVREGPTPSIERYGYRTDAEYYFPASSMKMPIALATYDRLAALRLPRAATIRIHPVSGGGEPYVTTLERETWRALIVSDNASANRLLGIVGHREANETLWSLGLRSARVRHGFSTGGEMDPPEASPRIEIVQQPTAGDAPVEIGARRSDLKLPANDATSLEIGRAKIVDGRREDGPLSFADKNAIRLRELQDTLVRIMRPDLLPAGSPADPGTKEDLAYLRQALGTLPSASGLAGYERNVVADYQLIPFLRGLERVKSRAKFQIFTKVGQAYGFLIANAYVVDKETGRSFFLVAAIYANPDEVMNSDNYGYDQTSFPALADVGEVFARHAFSQ